MPIDTSIYGNLQTPDFAGNIERGLRMRDLMDQRKKQTAIRDAYQKGTSLGPDGKLVVDRGLTIKSLYEVSPEDAIQAEDRFAQQDAAKAKGTREQLEQTLGNMKRAHEIFAAAKDQESWDQASNIVSSLGLMKREQISPVYDEKQQSFLANLFRTGTERLQQEQAERGWAFKENEALRDQRNKELDRGLKREEMYGKTAAGPKLTKAQEVVDSEFGKEYAGWTSGGRDSAYSEIEKLRTVANNLKNSNVTTGGLTGVLPDRMTSNAVLQARADVQSTVMNSLRAILGAQFTEKEGERIIKNTWNESDSTQNNLARVNRLVADLEAKAAAKDAKSQFYEEVGSLRGYKAGQSVAGRRQPVMTPGNREINILPRANAAGAGRVDYNALSDEELARIYQQRTGGGR